MASSEIKLWSCDSDNRAKGRETLNLLPDVSIGDALTHDDGPSVVRRWRDVQLALVALGDWPCAGRVRTAGRCSSLRVAQYGGLTPGRGLGVSRFAGAWAGYCADSLPGNGVRSELLRRVGDTSSEFTARAERPA
jgi:hypothetical protein